MSKTKELQDWLDKEIERVIGDLQILPVGEKSIAFRWNTRYQGLTSDESEEKFLKDQEKIKNLKKYLEFLRFTKEANIDIDAIAKICCDGFNFQLPKNGGYPALNGRFGKNLKIIIEWQIGFHLYVRQYALNSTFESTIFSLSGNIKINHMIHDAIDWTLDDYLIYRVFGSGIIRILEK